MGAEQTVRIDGVIPSGGSIPVILAGSSPSSGSAPSSANLLSGSVTDDSPIITIPANRIWYGWISLSASLVGVSQTATVTINTTGATANPPNGVDLLGVTLQTGAGGEGVNGDARTQYFYIYAGTSAAGIDVSIDGAAVNTAVAYGYLLA